MIRMWCRWVGQNMIFVSYDLHLICALVHYAKSVIFLSTVFFLLSGCPFRCFDRMPALSVWCGYHIPSERDAKNSVKVSVSSGTRHIFASMLKMCLAGTSLCQRCQRTDEILSAPNSPYHASEVDEQCSDDVKHWKDCFYRIKQNIPFRTTGFQCRLQCPFYRKIWKTGYPISQSPNKFTLSIIISDSLIQRNSIFTHYRKKVHFQISFPVPFSRCRISYYTAT